MSNALRRLDLPTAVVLAMTTAVAGCTADDPSPGGTIAPSTGETATASTTITPSSADPGRVRLVNLGDSYSAGTGVRPLVEDSPIYCQRSSRNFAHLVAAAEDFDLVDVSCAGADTADFSQAQYEGVPPQLDALDERADIVTVMIGGNNENTFGRAVDLCGSVAETDPLGAPCTDRHGQSLIGPVDDEIRPAIRAALREVKRTAPAAKVLYVGYPWLLPPGPGCYPTMKIAAGDVALLRRLQIALDDAARGAADEEGVRFVDMLAPSVGHDACAGGQRWIEPMTTPGPGRLHPNAQGQEAIAEQVRKALVE